MMRQSFRGDASAGSIADVSKWPLPSKKQLAKYGMLALFAAFLCWLAWLYGTSLRDPRYFDGWMLAGAMSFQIYFHFGQKLLKMSPKTLTSLRRRHVLTGWVLIAIFFSHTQLGLPDNSIEFVLWLGFILVSISGIFGTYISWIAPSRLGPGDQMNANQTLTRITELAQEAKNVVKIAENGRLASILPKAPHQEWIDDLYNNRLWSFFARPRPRLAHLAGSRKVMKQLVEEMDMLERYLDAAGQKKLRTLRELVIEKDRLDYVYTNLKATKLWLFVHVPITYTLIIMAVLHILVVYSYRSGAM